MNKDAYFSIPDTSEMDPLTLDQYNALNGRPVIVEKNTGKKWWAIAQSISGDTCGYGRFWWAYAYPLAHIDREAWHYCEACKPDCYNCLYQDAWDTHGKPDRCKKCVEFSNHVADEKFCEKCGKPRTPEAWAELEKRIGGSL